MNYRRWSLFVVLLPCLAACATHVKESALPGDHPASPQAAEATWTDPVPTLERDALDDRRTGEALAVESRHEHSEPSGDSPSIYTCPMHPDVQQDASGSCPKCGMRLVRKPVAR